MPPGLTSFRASPDGGWQYTAVQLIEKLRFLKADGGDINANLTFLNADYPDPSAVSGKIKKAFPDIIHRETPALYRVIV